MTTDELRAKLTEYGADVDGIVERFMDDADFYKECLLIFLDDENFPLLRHALNENNYEVAFDAAHAIKGLAGNMGLTPLYTAVCDITESLRAKDYTNLAEQYARVAKCYLQVHQLDI